MLAISLNMKPMSKSGPRQKNPQKSVVSLHQAGFKLAMNHHFDRFGEHFGNNHHNRLR
jgi:hypothetical protein